MTSEVEYFTDDAKLIAELLKEQWSLGPGEEPVVSYVPESYFMQSRTGSIFVYRVSMPMSISTTDYRTLQRLGYVAIKLSVRDRERFFVWGQEVMRILLANRRAPVLREYGYTFYEVSSVKETPDLSGWYSATYDIKLTCYNRPIISHGFGPDVCPRELPDGSADYGMNDPGECSSDEWTGGSAPDEPDDPGECEQGWTGGSAEDEPDDQTNIWWANILSG